MEILGEPTCEDAMIMSTEEKSNPITYHIRTIWLFSKSNIKWIIYPHVTFSISVALSGPLLTTNRYPEAYKIFFRLIPIILWLALNILFCDLSNQNLPSAIQEDKINKPWRPIPSGRITPANTRRLLLVAIPLAILLSIHLGAVYETTFLVIALFIYNDLGGGNQNPHLRDFLNAVALLCFSSGTARIATGYPDFVLNDKGWIWVGIHGARVMTTISVQDLSDMPGDAAAGRRTMPIVYGDVPVRWMLAAAILFWSWLSPFVLECGLCVVGLSICGGAAFAFHVVKYRHMGADKRNRWYWCLWTMFLYALPPIKDSRLERIVS